MGTFRKALVGYGRLAFLVEQVEKGLPSLLKAIVIDQVRAKATRSRARNGAANMGRRIRA